MSEIKSAVDTSLRDLSHIVDIKYVGKYPILTVLHVLKTVFANK